MKLSSKAFVAFALALFTLMFMITPPMQLVAFEALLNGTCGDYDNLTWKKTEDTGVLTISGYGAMHDYYPWDGVDPVPWTIYAPENYKIVKINLPDGLTRIGDYAFYSPVFFDSITHIEIPDSVTDIGMYAFEGCNNLETLKLPGSLRNIEEHAFWHCEKLKGTITVPYGMTTIGNGTFSGCKSLSHIDIPDTVTTIGVAAFLECSGLTSISIPDSVTEIQDSAFNSCTGLTEFVIPNGVQKIATWTFGNCTNLKSITIPDTVTTIGYMAFDGCNISDVYYSGSKSQWESITIEDLNDGLSNATIHYGALDPEDKVKLFIKHLYQTSLGREPEADGLNYWANSLMTGEKKAVDVVKGVLCSPEYGSKNKSNGEVVNDCYQAMLGRNADEDGYSDWVSRLESGMSVNAIFAGFVGSREFSDLCDSYGIQPGTFELTEERDKNVGVTEFVSRLYTQALGREFDVDGLNDWCGQINRDSSKNNILNISTNGFFHSQEFTNKNLNNTDFVKVLYRTFLGREYDDAGLADWVGKLDRGEQNRDQVMAGFAYSPEFNNIMAQYGIGQ